MRAAINFPSTGAPIDDATITENILSSQAEIEAIYHTFFGSVEEDATADSGTTSSLTDTGAFTGDSYAGYVLWVYSGTGNGQYRKISSHTDNILTITPNFATAPDNTSKYRVIKLGYADETVDGTGKTWQFVDNQPLINLVALTIDSTSVTTTQVYQYLDEGKLQLKTTAEKTYFVNTLPQQINLKYVFGVYPVPTIISRLCICIAGIKTLVAQIAGTYDDFTSVSLPGGVSGSKGEPYTNIKAAIQGLQQEAKGIIHGQEGDQLEGTYNKLPAYRPFQVFG